jgi:hypothetical protein
MTSLLAYFMHVVKRTDKDASHLISEEEDPIFLIVSALPSDDERLLDPELTGMSVSLWTYIRGLPGSNLYHIIVKLN